MRGDTGEMKEDAHPPPTTITLGAMVGSMKLEENEMEEKERRKAGTWRKNSGRRESRRS